MFHHKHTGFRTAMLAACALGAAGCEGGAIDFDDPGAAIQAHYRDGHEKGPGGGGRFPGVGRGVDEGFPGQGEPVRGAFPGLAGRADASVPASSNGFVLGMFPVGPWYTPTSVNGCNAVVEAPLGSLLQPTSQLNVLGEDGFSVVQDYFPAGGTHETQVTSLLRLVGNNGLKMHMNAKEFYEPLANAQCTTTMPAPGVNDFTALGNWNPCTSITPRPNYLSLIQNVYSNLSVKDAVWGHHITEEASYCHCVVNSLGVCWPYCNPVCSREVEVPPANVSDALDFFRSQGIGNQKLVVMEANHHKAINDSTLDGQAFYNPQDYLTSKYMTARADVFLEGSYTLFPESASLTQSYSQIYSNGYHYLGPFTSIDYGLRQVPEVHKVLNIQLDQPGYLNNYHGSTAVPNANWLWFQGYNSVVHRASGVWFWGLNLSWNGGQPPSGWSNLGDRFAKYNFPPAYNAFVAPLASELRYLVNHDLVSTVPASLLHTKRAHPDNNCIVPSPPTYMPIPPPDLEHLSEHYGLRYSMRTNPSGDIVLIVTNPLDLSLSATLDFRYIVNPTVAGATSVDALFETSADVPISPAYKTTRTGRANLATDTVAARAVAYSTVTKKLTDVFGPLDVHVYRFNKGAASPAKSAWYHAAFDWDALPLVAGNMVPAADGNHVFYRGVDHRLYNFWLDSAGWRNDALDYNAPALVADNVAVGTDDHHVFYRGTDQRLYNFWWTGTKWQNDALDYFAPPRVAGDVVVSPDGHHVFYRGIDHRLYNFWWTGAKWQNDALDYNASPLVAGDVRLGPSGTSNVFYRGTDARMYNFWWNGTKWRNDVLSLCPPAQVAGNVVVDKNGHVIYRGLDNRGYLFYWTDGKSGI